MKEFIAFAVASIAAFGVYADQGRIYWGGEFGISKLEDNTGNLTSSLVNTLGGSASATQDSTISAFKILGGYRFTENLDLELGYFQSGSANLSFSGVTSGSVSYTGNGNLKWSGFEYAANLRPSVASGWNDLYFRVGGHSSKLEVDVSVTASGYSAYSNNSYSGTGSLYGFGYDQRIGEMMKIRYSVVKYSKVGGESDSGGSVYSVGLIKNFD